MKFYRESVNTKNNNTITEAEEANSKNLTLLEDMESSLRVLEQYISNMIKKPVHFDIEESSYGVTFVSKEDFADSCGVMSDIFESVKLQSFDLQLDNNCYYTIIDWVYGTKSGGHNSINLLSVWYNHSKNLNGWIVRRPGQGIEKL